MRLQFYTSAPVASRRKARQRISGGNRWRSVKLLDMPGFGQKQMYRESIMIGMARYKRLES